MDIPQKFADAMAAHSLEEDPNECCGILASKDGNIIKHYRITNSERSPFRYSMDSIELFHAYRDIEDNGWDLAVIYHSHTHSPAYPSVTDVRLATWPDAYYVLVSLMDKQAPDIRAYSIVEGQVTEDTVIIS